MQMQIYREKNTFLFKGQQTVSLLKLKLQSVDQQTVHFPPFRQ